MFHYPATRLTLPVPTRRCLPRLECLEARAVPASFRQTNLVADQAGVAQFTDPTLINPWGISLSPAGGAFWLSGNGTGLSQLYVGDVTPAGGTPSAIARPFAVTIPEGSPTGQVFNPTQDFVVTSGTASRPAIFIFASTSGIISGWNPAVPAPPSRQAVVGFDSQGTASFTGLALANSGGSNFLYAADFRNRVISVFDSTFQPTTLAGNFQDPNLPTSYSPFNVQALAGKIFVTYAHRDNTGDGLPDGGSGFISVFDTQGNFLQRLVKGNGLSQPYGMAIAPADFGPFGGSLLVANHGNGEILAFDPNTGQKLGELEDASGHDIRIDGLFGLAFGNGISAGDRNALYFTAGPDGGTHGLFGSLRFVPDAPSAAFGGAAGESVRGASLVKSGAPGSNSSSTQPQASTTAGDRVFLDPSLGTSLGNARQGLLSVAGFLRGPRAQRVVADLAFSIGGGLGDL